MYDDLLPIASNDADETTSTGNNGDGTASTRDNEGQGRDEKSAVTEPKDMLVMRLDDSIDKALRTLPNDLDGPSPFVVNETVDAVASEVESMEEKTKNEWVENHAVIDGDGRARCSFHFCRKLFKDGSFLKKHLLKKHGEYLKAETAKCHDSYMMSWWDEEICRPVPQILVNCGKRFGKIPCSVTGGADPHALDPEPELWRKEQEKIQQEEEKEERYREKKAAAADYAERNRKYSEPRDNGTQNHEGIDGGAFTGGGSNFVDVDDMKDEKVELSFNNIVAAAPTPKKRKKKKKKLL
mmetsp:Transcript_13780/g.20164  ORF Transcript_13780/g.20164 Transcript_13780/m.20164 type:complete len:296 (+) Transcript_13780:70-957(+)